MPSYAVTGGWSRYAVRGKRGLDHPRYTSDDVRHLHALHESLQRIIDKNGVRQAYEDTLRVLPPLYIEAQIRGAPLDKERF
jgi:hypothetical protein